eukprot:CAMPEP_0169091064 /NCGR_PEP_ID=MMETSP1015-20121227/16162_1 /TAXON_ID=342587 /ORGANISM="Karlodinium micrum, Strain CCMP2283" /LENGTH=76 /DNA_ID=CAMNT_0009151529 /DNA_START=247 /DNA_END=473 /DNA_ORIENTATION=-
MTTGANGAETDVGNWPGNKVHRSSSERYGREDIQSSCLSDPDDSEDERMLPAGLSNVTLAESSRSEKIKRLLSSLL